MNKLPFRVFTVIALLSITITTPNSLTPASAAPASHPLLAWTSAQLARQPCVRVSPPETYRLSGVEPQFYCKGHLSAEAIILVPIPKVVPTPSTSIVGVPTILSVGWEPSHFNMAAAAPVDLPPTRWERIYGYQVQLRAVAWPYVDSPQIPPTNRNYAPYELQVHVGYNENTIDEVCGRSLMQIPGEFGGIRDLVCENQKNGPAGISNTFYVMGSSGRPDWFWVQAEQSSIWGGMTFNGEPAYRIRFASLFRIQARSVWQDREAYEIVGWKEVCDWYYNRALGFWEWRCRNVPIREWVRKGPGGTQWTNPNGSTVFYEHDFVMTPDNKLSRIYPLLVYQSQPLLKPSE